MSIVVNYTAPAVADFIELRQSVGWGETAPELAQKALNNSLFCVVFTAQSKAIAMARVVGDGALFFYIQDVIVHPEFQGRGLGAKLMDEIESFLKRNARKGATIGLFSATGKEAFYERYQYLVRTGEPLGNGMCKFI